MGESSPARTTDDARPTGASLKELYQAAAKQAEQDQAAVLLMTHPGVGPVTSLAFVLTLGPVKRFERSKQVGELLGTESARAFFGWKPTIGIDLQARQSYDAFVAGGSRPQCGAFIESFSGITGGSSYVVEVE
jgi:hypothetical protein